MGLTNFQLFTLHSLNYQHNNKKIVILPLVSPASKPVMGQNLESASKVPQKMLSENAGDKQKFQKQSRRRGFSRLQYISPLDCQGDIVNFPSLAKTYQTGEFFGVEENQVYGEQYCPCQQSKSRPENSIKCMPQQKIEQTKQNCSELCKQIQSQQNQSCQIQKIQHYEIVKVKWNKFIQMKKNNFQDDYQIMHEIGRGGFGCVYKVMMKSGPVYRAAKKINKDKLKKQQHQNLIAEMVIMMSLDHPNITKLYQVYDQETYYIMVMQLCQGGELLQHILNGKIDEKQAKLITQQVLSALNYIHQKGIVHRDIKPENMLIEKSTNLIKIIDFGISAKIKTGYFLTMRIGTPYYLAPQVICRKYNQKCDIWSLGVVLYMIVFNSPPFQGNNTFEVMENILKQEISFKTNSKTKFSAECVEFMQSILNKDFKKRPNARQALGHDWLKKTTASKTALQDSDAEQKVMTRLTNFHFKNKIQAVVHTFIVSQLLTSQQRIQLLNFFRKIDQDQNGTIDSEEIKKAFKNCRQFVGLDDHKIELIIDYIDTNCSGHIDYTQFLVAAIDFDQKVTQAHLEQAFCYFDIDKSGGITFEQLVKFLENEVKSKDEIRALLQSVDKDGDGLIGKSQFVQLMMGKQRSSLVVESK